MAVSNLIPATLFRPGFHKEMGLAPTLVLCLGPLSSECLLCRELREESLPWQLGVSEFTGHCFRSLVQHTVDWQGSKESLVQTHQGALVFSVHSSNLLDTAWFPAYSLTQKLIYYLPPSVHSSCILLKIGMPLLCAVHALRGGCLAL